MEKFISDKLGKTVFFFFERVGKLGEISSQTFKIISFLSFMQFLSLNIDRELWGSLDFFNYSLIQAFSNYLKPFQLHFAVDLDFFPTALFSVWMGIAFFMTILYFAIFTKKSRDERLNNIIISYNKLLILLVCPCLRSLSWPFSLEKKNTALIVLSALGILLITVHCFINIYIINENMFSETKRLNRFIYKEDFLRHFVIILPIIFGLFFKDFQWPFFISAALQISCFLILLTNLSQNLVYFDVGISIFEAKALIFKICFLLIEIFIALIKRECGVTLLLMGSFVVLFSNNLTNRILNNFLFDRSKKGNGIKEEDDFMENFKKLFVLFSFFFYHTKEDGKNYASLIKVLPVEFVTYVSKLEKDCKKMENLDHYTHRLRQHILDLSDRMKFVKESHIQFFLMVMPFRLLKPPRLFQAIHLIDRIQRKRQHFTFWENLGFLNFLEKIKDEFMVFENSGNKFNIDENSLISKTTNFFSQKFYEFNQNYEKLSKEIEKYARDFLFFLENMKSESPNILLMERLGVSLLQCKQKIATAFKCGEENPIFISKYSLFLQTFVPDRKKEIIKLIKKLNSLILIEKTTLKENSLIYDFIIENMTFSTASSFLHVSGCLESLGKIQKLDSNLLSLLDYKEKMELIGNNVSMIIPALIAENHQARLESYLINGESSFTFREQNVQAKKENGELVNVNLTVKPHLMEVENKLVFFCHLKANNDKRIHSTLLLDRYGFIDSYGGKIREILDPLFKKHGKKFYLQMFLPVLESFFEKNEIFDYEENDEELVHFFRVMENYEVLQERIKENFDREKFKKIVGKFQESIKALECGEHRYRIDFELKAQKFKSLSFFLLNIHSLTYCGFRSWQQRQRAEKSKKDGEFLLTKMPIFALKTTHMKKMKTSGPGSFQNQSKKVLVRRSKSLDFPLFQHKPAIIFPLKPRRNQSEELLGIKFEKSHLKKERKNTFRLGKGMMKDLEAQETFDELRYFGENKRFIYAKSSTQGTKKDELLSHPSVSSVHSSIGKDIKENFFAVIHIEDVPSCYIRYVYFHFLLFLLAVFSLVFLSVILSSTITTINNGFNQTFLIENFKIRFLKTLFYAHKYKKFNSTFELSKINDQGNKMAVDIVQLLYPPFNKINTEIIDIFLGSQKKIEFTSVDAVNFFNAISIDAVKHPYKVDLIILNALNIFKLLEGIANVLEILLSLVGSVETNLIIYAGVVASIASIIVLLQIMNLTSCFSFINENYKKLLTIPNDELNKIVDYINNTKELRIEKTKKKQPKAVSKMSIKSFNPKKPVHKINLKASHKKKHPTELINSPIIKAFLIALISLAIFCCFVILILYKASFLDYSIVKFLEGEVAFQRSKAYNYMYIIRRVNKLYLNNSYHYIDSETAELFEKMREGVNVLITHADDFEGTDRTNYVKAINENICTAKMSTFPLTANLSSCPKLASGQFTKGMVGALSFAILLFEQDLAGAFDLKVQSNIDLLDYSIILYDRKLRDVAQNTLTLVSNNLNQQNSDSLNLNIGFVIMTSMFLIGFYLFYLKKNLRARLVNSKLVYQILPSKVLFKSLAIKSYLKKLLDQKIRRI